MEVDSVVRDANWGLLSPFVFVALCAVVVAALAGGRLWMRLIAIACVLGAMMYREHMLGIFVRIVSDGVRGKQYSIDQLDGARVMWRYCSRTSLYAVGSGLLLALMSVLPLRKKGPRIAP